MVFSPVGAANVTVQVPVPLVMVIEQVASPVIAIVWPLGMGNPLVIVTTTLTVWPVVDGSGLWDVIARTVGYLTLWFSVSLLATWVESPP